MAFKLPFHYRINIQSIIFRSVIKLNGENSVKEKAEKALKLVQDGNHGEVEKILETNNEWINFRYTICLTLNMTQENSNTIQNGFKELNDLEKNSSLLSQQRFFIDFIQKKFQVLIFLPIVHCNSHYSFIHLQAEFYFYGY